MSEVRVKVKLTFPESEVRRAVLATLVRRFDVDPDIRRADVEEHRGWIVCEMDGQAAQVEAALDWLRGEGITRRPPGGRPRGMTPGGVQPCSGSWGTCHPAEDTLRGS